MRRRAWAAWGLLALGVALGMAGRSLPGARAWHLAGGLCLAAALVVAASLLPFWGRLGLEPMPGLFRAPGRSQRWCAHCGNPTSVQGACRTCGHTPASRGRRA